MVSNRSSVWPIVRIFSKSPLVRIGWRTSSRLRREVPSRSKMLGRGPMKDTRLITSSSRIGSIGGLVYLREVSA